MSEIESTESAGRSFDRRTVLKGAAWSVPVLAAAIATPMASASTTPQALLDLNAGCIQVAGVSLFPGFSVNNVGDDTWAGGTITVVETIDLTGIPGLLGSPVRGLLWPVLAVQGIASGSSSGVSTGGWTTVQGGGVLQADLVRQRTITINTAIAAGGRAYWGNLFDVGGVLNILEGLGLEVIRRSAQITNPTGNPPVVDAGPSTLSYNLLGGC